MAEIKLSREEELLRDTRNSCIDKGKILQAWRMGEERTGKEVQLIRLPFKPAEIPHSELAIHTGAAGREILSAECTKGEEPGELKYCEVIYRKKDETCGIVDGLPKEVLPHELIRG